MQNKVILRFLVILSMGYSQILWNEPPDTIFYDNQSRWIEVILPRPKQFKATTINQNQVKLTIEPYWTDNFITAYTDKFGYEPIPNRYSLYKDGNALSGMPTDDTVFIDYDVVLGETYNYEYIASDLNYQTIGGLQHWSPRSNPTSITVGSSQSGLTYPSNFQVSFNASNKCIDLLWDFVNGATSYTIFKSLYNTQNQQWEYYDFQHISDNNYQDTNIIEYTDYLYSIKTVCGNDYSDRSPPIAISTLSFDFGAPSNFCGNYVEKLGSIILSWDNVPSANSYEIFKSYINPETGNWIYRIIETNNLSEYIDVKLLPNQTYFYQILSKCDLIKSERSKTIMITSGTLSLVNNGQINKYKLDQNSPNPFNPTTKISYSLPIDSQVSIVIYNLLGDKVKTLVNNSQLSGNHFISWDGTNNNDDQVVCGIYFYTIQADGFNQTKKMIYLK